MMILEELELTSIHTLGEIVPGLAGSSYNGIQFGDVSNKCGVQRRPKTIVVKRILVGTYSMSIFQVISWS
jgi:hypothetical protein